MLVRAQAASNCGTGRSEASKRRRSYLKLWVLVALEELNQAWDDPSADDLLDRWVTLCSKACWRGCLFGEAFGTDEKKLAESDDSLKLSGAIFSKHGLGHSLQVIEGCWL